MTGPPPRSTLFPSPTLSRSLEAVPVRVERRPRLDGLGVDPADRHAAHLGLGRDVVDQGRDFVFLGHEPAHHRERSEEHTSELQSQSNLVCRLLLEKKKKYRS